jgi:hypothetical protein
MACTGFVPESITGGIAAGQDSGDRYMPHLEMNRTTRFSDLRRTGETAADLPFSGWRGMGRDGVGRGRLVPVLYRRNARNLVDSLGAVLLAALLYPFVRGYVRDMRRAGAR